MATWRLVNVRTGDDGPKAFRLIPPIEDAQEGFVWSHYLYYYRGIPFNTPNMNYSYKGASGTGRWEGNADSMHYVIHIIGDKIKEIQDVRDCFETKLGIVDLTPKLALPESLKDSFARIKWFFRWICTGKN